MEYTEDYYKYITQEAENYAEELEYQLAFRQGAQAAMLWVNKKLENAMIKRAGGLN